MQPVYLSRLAMLIGVAVAFPAVGQVTTPDSGTILQTLPKAPPTIDTGPDVENLLQKRRVVSDVEGLELTIRAYAVKGATVITDDEIRQAVKPYTGERKTFQDILDAAAAVRRKLGELGYFLADVVVPEQDVTGGVVELVVLEGRLGNVTVEYAPDVVIDHKVVEGYLSALKTGDLVRTRSVERALFLVNDLRGISATSTFKPGEKPGTADLVVVIDKTPIVSGFVDADINGAVVSGQQRIGANLDVNNFLNKGGLINIRAIRGMDRKFNLNQPQETVYGRISFLLPVTSYGFRIGASISKVEYSLSPAANRADPSVDLGFSGTAHIGSVFTSYPFVRSRNLNLIGNLQFDNRRFEDIQERPTPDVGQKGANVAILSLNSDFRDTLFGGGINLAGLTYTRGRLDLQTPGLISNDNLSLRTEGAYEKYQASFGRLQQINRDWLLYANMQMQLASKNLDSSEKMVLGGAYGIRSLSPTEGIGDEGYLGNIELRRVIAGKYIPGNLVGALFYDFGGIRRNHNAPASVTQNTDRLDSAGIGAYWEPRGWYVRASVAGRHPRLYLQAIKYF